MIKNFDINQLRRILLMRRLLVYLLVLKYLNRLKVTDTDTGTVVLGEYIYNANGQRVKKTASGRIIYFIYDQSGNLIEEADELGQVNIDYIYLGSVPIARVDEWWEGMPIPQAPTGLTLTPGDTQLTVTWNPNTDTGTVFVDGYKVYWGVESGKYTNTADVGKTTTYTITGLTNSVSYYVSVTAYADLKRTLYYHVDHLGTPIMMTDKDQNIVWGKETLPFGEEYSSSGSVINNLGFPGQFHDSETGLSYNWWRYYNDELGRYDSFDPILHLISRAKQPGACSKNSYSLIPRTFALLMENPKFLNPQVYVANDPINLIDPTGLMPQTEGEWLNLIKKLIAAGKICNECKDIYKHLHNNIQEECSNCCQAVAKAVAGATGGLWHTWYSACVADLCL